MKTYLTIISLGLLLGSNRAFSDEDNTKAFRQVCSEKVEQADGTMAIKGEDGWLFLNGELRHLSIGTFWGESAASVSKATKPEWRDPLPAILDFKESLDNAGIELLLVPVPPKAAIYPDKLDAAFAGGAGKAPARIDAAAQEFYALLREKGVNVLDLYPVLSEHRSDAAGTTYCRQDSHWSGRGCELAAENIIETIKERDWLKAANKETFDSEVRPTAISGDLWAAAAGDKPDKEALPLRFVGRREGGNIKPIEPDESSSVLLLGDSHTLVFHAGGDMLARGAGLADQLTLGLGFPVDLIGVRGSGATPARINLFRKARANADYLKDKKLIIWCFTAREFTEATSGWRKVPLQ